MATNTSSTAIRALRPPPPPPPPLHHPPPPPPPPKSRPRPPFWHRARSRLGFQKTYNLVLFLVLGVLGIAGQGLVQAPKLDYFHVFCRRNHLQRRVHAAPGECYHFLNGGRAQVGMMLHIYAVVPLCLLVALQFVPVVRQRWRRLHRVGGYAVLLLTGVAVGGGVLAAPGSFGGEGAWRLLVGVLAGMMAGGLGMSMGHIWRLQVAQHRAWMLRTWAWAFSSVTMRMLQQLGAHLLSPTITTTTSSSYFSTPTYYSSLRPCAQIASDGVLPDFVIAARWPACRAYLSGQKLDQTVLVTANYSGTPIEANVALSLAAGPAAWVALLLHVVAVELYLHLTATETQRLRQASYHKQRSVAGPTASHHLGRSPSWFHPLSRGSIVLESKINDSKQPKRQEEERDIKSLDMGEGFVEEKEKEEEEEE